MSFESTCKTFEPGKGTGLIDSATGVDIHLDMQDCVGDKVPRPGDVLRFDLRESTTEPGRMEANKVSGGTGNKPGAHRGSCKFFKLDKGFGFITRDGDTEVFFLAHKFVDGSTPKPGDILSFDLEPNPKKAGQMQATNIAGGTGLAAAATGHDSVAAAQGSDSWGWGKDGPYGGGKGDYSYGAAKGSDMWSSGKDGPFGGFAKGGKDAWKNDGGKGKMLPMMAEAAWSNGGGGSGVYSWGDGAEMGWGCMKGGDMGCYGKGGMKAGDMGWGCMKGGDMGCYGKAGMKAGDMGWGCMKGGDMGGFGKGNNNGCGNSGTSGKGQKPGDWTCPSCGDNQFARNVVCRKCGAPKPNENGGGKGACGGGDSSGEAGGVGVTN